MSLDFSAKTNSNFIFIFSGLLVGGRKKSKWAWYLFSTSLVLLLLVLYITMRIVPYELWGSSKCGGPSEFNSSSELDRNFRRSWAKIFRPRLFRKCECTACSEPDKKVEEFFTKKRYWWSSRTLWKISWNQFHEIFRENDGV